MRRNIRIGYCIAWERACARQAQWLNNPTPGAPRTPDGQVNMTGPAPHVNGKPDLSGIWQAEAEPRAPGGLYGLGESANSKYFRDILSDFKPGEEPLTALGAEMLKQHGAAGPYGNPSMNCLPDGVPHADLLPEPFKIIQTPGELLMLYEVETIFRQVFTDGRKQPADPAPSWLGYSVGRWDGDTLVIDTKGFNDRSWLDARGHGHSEEMRVEERFQRRDFGHLDVAVTLEDPKVFTKPFTIHFAERLLPDTDVFEHICAEDEKDAAHTAKALNASALNFCAGVPAAHRASPPFHRRNRTRSARRVRRPPPILRAPVRRQRIEALCIPPRSHRQNER